MGGLPGPIRVRHPSTDRTAVHLSTRPVIFFFETGGDTNRKILDSIGPNVKRAGLGSSWEKCNAPSGAWKFKNVLALLLCPDVQNVA
jgi:hypothetical protein